MPDALTSDDLRRGASEARDNGYPEEADRLSAAADLMNDQGWRLTPPPDPTEQPLPPLSCGVTRPHEPHLHPVGKRDVEVWCCGVTPPQPGRVTVNVDDGAGLIAAERQRQVEQEGWTPEHDAEHPGEGLALAAVCYALPDFLRFHLHGVPVEWPWGVRSWKPTPGDRVRELVKAGALIAAEIDRLQAHAAALAEASRDC